MKKSVALHTLGCKLNYSETSTIGSQFMNNGYTAVNFNEKADVYVFNTCSVTESAEKECRQLVRRALRTNPDAFIIVTGCYAQLRPEEISKIEGVDVILGSREKFNIFSLINDFDKKDLACIFTSPTQDLGSEFGPAHSTDGDSRTRAYFKIQDGCDYKCSFCTIPIARGASRSMVISNAIDEFQKLVDQGYKEIILTGVNVGDYGKSFNVNLRTLLEKFVEIPGDFRIRISSIEPNLLSDELINLTAETDKICSHFHIPLQSGSPDILKLMRRRYSVEDYHDTIYKTISRIPEAGIGVDVITGFPGETNDKFLETYNFIKDLPISYLHVFTYSERPDTKAIELPGTVDVFERRKRTRTLRILSDKKRYQFHSRFLNKNLRVLFESENKDGQIKGFSSNYIRVSHVFNPNLVNEFSQVKLVSSAGNQCNVEILENENSVDLIAS